MNNPHITGSEFENQVHDVLLTLSQKFSNRVHVARQPRLRLQNDEEVVPDFDLLVVLPHERQFYFVECQAREGYSKDILHKIRHIRSKSWRQTFLFVYPVAIPDELERALDIENVLHFSLPEFRAYIGNIGSLLEGLPPVDEKESIDPSAIIQIYAQ